MTAVPGQRTANRPPSYEEPLMTAVTTRTAPTPPAAAAPEEVLPGAEELERLVGRIGGGLEQRWEAGASLLHTMCAHALVPAGKLFRPILLLEAALAVGGDVETVLPAAIGAESGHVASLVHDDIIDDDEIRRGRPSVQHKFGVDNAIVAGDALIFDLFLSLAECHRTGARAERIVAALDVVARCGIDLCRGQSLEAELSVAGSYDVPAYLRMIALKTAALFRGACQCGALLAGGTEPVVEALGVYAENLGVAFQIHDDLLPYTRDARTVGKSDTSDVRNGRRTLPVILAHERGSDVQRRVIEDALGGTGDAGYRRDALCGVLEATGALAAAAARARSCVDAALGALEALPPTPSRARLRGFAEAAVDRDR